MGSFSFRIRKRYFDDIVAGKKTVEYRRDIVFWRIRVVNVVADPEFIRLMVCTNKEIEPMSIDADGVFICGKRIHRRKITAISRIRTPGDFSDQGKKDVDTELCFAFHLGEEVKKCSS